MSFAKEMKEKIDQLEIERHLKELVDETEKTAAETVEKAGRLAHEKRGEVEGWLGKATETVNTKTKGQYADKVDKARAAVLEGLDKLAAKRPMEPVAEIETRAGADTGVDASDGSSPASPEAPASQESPESSPESSQDRPTDPPLS